MINAEKSVFLQETEVKPNKYSQLVLTVLFLGSTFCWMLNEIGLFRVGKWEMRIGTAIPAVFILGLLILMKAKAKLLESCMTKWMVFAVSTVFAFFISTLLTFHTTIMLLFPIFIAMLYRSVPLGIASVCSSVFCTVFTPIFGYLLKTWDIPLFEELIGIGTGGSVIVENATYETSLLSIGKIVLYLVLPRLVMVGSCSILMFHVIKLGREHTENQVKLDGINRRDVLTGLYNQNYYKQILASDNESQTVGVVFFDVNGLKSANDKFGHEYGDLLLKRCADSLTSICDGEKIHGFRVGGDEFLVVIEDADESKVMHLKTKWIKKLDIINEENKSRYFGMVCSMAYGYQIGNITDLEDLVRRADLLMYQNKAKIKAESK